MTHRQPNPIRRRLAAAAMAMMLVLAIPLAGLGQESPKPAEIKAVPELDGAALMTKAIEADQKEQGVRYGTVEALYLEDNTIVISDAKRALAADCRYMRTRDGFSASRSDFQPGTRVGYILNENRQVARIWLIK